MSYQFIYDLPDINDDNDLDGSRRLRQLTYQTEIEAHMGRANEAVLSYISLLDQERAQRALISSSEITEPEQSPAQSELTRIRQQLKDLAVQFFKWKFDVQDLKKVDLLTQYEIDLLIISKLEVYGLPDDPVRNLEVSDEEKDQWHDAFRQVLIYLSEELQKRKETQDRLSTRISGEMPFSPPLDQGRNIDADDPPTITSKLVAYMQVEKQIKSVLNDLQKSAYPNCICDGMRIYSVPLGMPVFDVSIEYNEKGQPLRYLCSLFVNNEKGIVLSNSDDHKVQSLISTIRDMHLRYGAQLWIGVFNLPDHW